MHDQTPLDDEKRAARFPVTLDGSTSKPLPIPRANLKKIDGVRVEMAKVYRAMKMGTLEGAEGTKRAYVLSLIGKLIEASELAKRIEALEQIMERR